MKEILQDLLDDLEFFVNSRKSNKDVKHIDEIIKKYKNKAINYSYCCETFKEEQRRPSPDVEKWMIEHGYKICD